MSGDVTLRETTGADLPIFFEQQLDPEANRMAAFTAPDPADRDAFAAKWRRIFADAGIVKRTILCEGRVAGSIVRHGWFGRPEVCYWIGREYWGRGIATRALEAFLREVSERPLHARVARDNAASLRVLEKCGFRRSGEGRAFSHARGGEVEELFLVLEP